MIGLVNINLHREIPDCFKVKGVRVVSRCRGTKWFVVITIQADVSVPDTLPYGRAIGVDVGLNDFLATSDGLKIPRPKFFVDLQSQLKLLQRRASRKRKRSANWEKEQLKVSRLHHKIDNTRKDWQLKVAHNLCDQADSIFVEDIDYRVMRYRVSRQAFSRCQFWSVQRAVEVGLLEAESWRCRLPSRRTLQEKRKVLCHSRP
jgi:putative transposase